MYCKNCGKQIEDDVRFCPHCGTSFKSPPIEDSYSPRHTRNSDAFQFNNCQVSSERSVSLSSKLIKILSANKNNLRLLALFVSIFTIVSVFFKWVKIDVMASASFEYSFIETIDFFEILGTGIVGDMEWLVAIVPILPYAFMLIQALLCATAFYYLRRNDLKRYSNTMYISAGLSLAIVTGFMLLLSEINRIIKKIFTEELDYEDLLYYNMVESQYEVSSTSIPIILLIINIAMILIVYYTVKKPKNIFRIQYEEQ